MKDTGVAGRPEEYFEARRGTGAPPHPGDYLAGLPRTGAGIRDDTTPPEAPEHSSLHGLDSYREHLQRTFELGTTPNGVFGTKLMWDQLNELTSLAGELPEYAGLETGELLKRLFGSPSYVWVSRRDKVRQAVSMWRALQTRSWRHVDRSEDSQGPELVYRFEGIDHLVGLFEADDRSWREFFATQGIQALPISYEDDLERDPDRCVGAVLERLGLAAPSGWKAEPPLKRQSDAISDEWVAQYHRDSTCHQTSSTSTHMTRAATSSPTETRSPRPTSSGSPTRG